MNNAIEIRGLVKKYPRFELGPLDLTVPHGAIYGLIGWSPGEAESLSATGLVFPQVLLLFYLLPFVVIAGLTCLVLAREKDGFRASLLLIPVQGVFTVALAAGGFFFTAFVLEPAAGIMNFGDLCKIGAAVLSLYLLFLDGTLRAGGRAGGATATGGMRTCPCGNIPTATTRPSSGGPTMRAAS